MIESNNGNNQEKRINSLVRSFDQRFVEAYLIGSGVLLIAIVLCLTLVNLLLIADVEAYLNSNLMTGLVIIANQIFICVFAALIYKKITGFFSKRSHRREQFWGKTYQYVENRRAKSKNRGFRQLLAEKKTERANQLLDEKRPNSEARDDRFVFSAGFRPKQFSGYLLNYDSLNEQAKSERD